MSYVAVIDFPLKGVRLGLRCGERALERVEFIDDHVALLAPRTALAKQAVAQIERYFITPDTRFDLPLNLRGSAFQKKVWQAIAAIDPGEVARYGELARRLGSSPRAVGNGCAVNPCPIVIPCHRVVAKKGLGGFMGQREGRGMAIKRWLLDHESGVS